MKLIEKTQHFFYTIGFKLRHKTKYYFITSVRRYIPDEHQWKGMVSRWKANGVWDNGSSKKREDYELEETRCWGFLKSKKRAIELVENNVTDLNEAGYYKYVVIETSYEGLLPYADNQMWFIYNRETGKYDRCEKPRFSEGIVNYCLG